MVFDSQNGFRTLREYGTPWENGWMPPKGRAGRPPLGRPGEEAARSASGEYSAVETTEALRHVEPVKMQRHQCWTKPNRIRTID